MIEKPVYNVILDDNRQTSGGTPPENDKGTTEVARPNNRRRNAIIASVAGLAVAAGAALGVNHLVNAEPASDKPVAADGGEPLPVDEPVDEPTDGETPVAPEVVEPTAENRVPTVETVAVDESLIANPEELVNTFISRSGDWFVAGATPENADYVLNPDSPGATMSPREYAEQLANEHLAVYTEALLVPDWSSKPALVQWVERMHENHTDTLEHYILTSMPNINPQDIAPYERGTALDSIVAIDDTDYGLAITTVEHDFDNADQNRVGEDLTSGTQVDESDTGQPTRYFVVVDGKVKLSDIVLAG